jgi:hypothetical protein
MTAKLLYTKQGTDPTMLLWPPAGKSEDRFQFTNGQTTTVPLIVYSDYLTYPDGRPFPSITPQGSTLVHQKT